MARSSFVPPVVTLLIAALALASIAAVCGQPDDERDLQSLGVEEGTIAAETETATSEAGEESQTPAGEGTVETATPEADTTETPTPESEATFVPGDVIKDRRPSTLPTAASVSEAMMLSGSIWVDARPVTGEVLAFVGGRQCGKGKSVQLMHGSLPIFGVEVASAAGTPGCGVPGVEVTISVDGRAMNETVLWAAGFQSGRRLIAGPEFGHYRGTILTDEPITTIVPYVNDAVCGETLDIGVVAAGLIYYNVVVDPEELKAGCGRPGAAVTFRALTDDGSRTDAGTSTWHTGGVVERREIEPILTDEPSPIATQVAS